MYKELYKYLILNKKISFPGIGSFVVEDIPSSVDEGIDIIKPWQQIIQFSNIGKAHFNQSLFSFLAKERNQNEMESEDKFNAFIVQLKNYLQSNDDVVLPMLGTLKNSGEEGITFVPHQKSIKHLFPLIGLPTELKVPEKKEELISYTEVVDQVPIIDSQPPVPLQVEEVSAIAVEEETVETVIEKKKDSWWIYAIVLTLAATGGLLYYYLYYINQPA